MFDAPRCTGSILGEMRGSNGPGKEGPMNAAEEPKYHHILLETDGPIALVTMNRPERRNALSLEHMLELIDAFRRIGRRGETAVAILRANGPAFCAGHDLSEMVDRDPAFYRQLFDVCIELMSSVQSI